MITKDVEKQLEDLTQEGNFLEAARIMMFNFHERNNSKTIELYDKAIEQAMTATPYDRTNNMRMAAKIAYEAKFYTRASQYYAAAHDMDMAKFCTKLKPLEREVA